MPYPRLPASLVALIFFCAACPAADAAECQWFGTAPLCDGECPTGWQQKTAKQCFSGWKVYCCEPEEPCGPSRYGTEGCPYPPFGSSSSSGEKPPAGPTADSIMENQRQKQSGTNSSGVLVPEQSKGPSPFGGGKPAGVGVLQRPSDALNSNIIKKEPEPCGPGMYRGGDGQCYPIVH